MGWVVRGPDGDVPFDTHDEAVAYEESLSTRDARTPDEIWATADRPKVSRETFNRRMTMGWSGDRALYTTMDGRYLRIAVPGKRRQIQEQMGGHNAAVHEVLGRKRTLEQWSASCGIPASQLRHGVDRHGSLQSYLLSVGWYPSKPAVPGDPEASDDRFT